MSERKHWKAEEKLALISEIKDKGHVVETCRRGYIFRSSQNNGKYCNDGHYHRENMQASMRVQAHAITK